VPIVKTSAPSGPPPPPAAPSTGVAAAAEQQQPEPHPHLTADQQKALAERWLKYAHLNALAELQQQQQQQLGFGSQVREFLAHIVAQRLVHVCLYVRPCSSVLGQAVCWRVKEG